MQSSNGHSAPPLSLSSKARRTREQPINSLIAQAMANPELVNFAAGLVDSHTLPGEMFADMSQAILTDHVRSRAALQYETTIGLAELRRLALRHLETLENKPAADMGLTPADFVITTGSQQALYIIGDVLIDPGDIVIAANPSYFVYTGTLQSLGAKVMTVPTVVTSLLPIMWSHSTGAEVMKPLATPVLGGMVSSLGLVLIVTPVMFSWLRERELRRAETSEGAVDRSGTRPAPADVDGTAGRQP